MQKTASAVLRRLRPDNARDFAELVTEGILQAAATGEALLDDELAGLARRDPSRFQRLNQRLQACSHMPCSCPFWGQVAFIQLASSGICKVRVAL